ncbi:MAG TPA: AbrB/MazE/SpoVT family DNA-binding domain-containing protein [Xanthomonadales bacterium]|nr:AbrB/MazE/SpoVT family DNA-binding domain-containing protein [Xanthomonadales bacterium]
MQQKVIKVGNSAGFILPQSIRQQTGLNPGDKVNIEASNKNVVISPVKTPSHGVDVKFMKIVDEFINDHDDVLRELAER